MSNLDRFPFRYSHSDDRAQSQAERRADFVKDLRKERELDELRDQDQMCRPTEAMYKALKSRCSASPTMKQEHKWEVPILAPNQRLTELVCLWCGAKKPI